MTRTRKHKLLFIHIPRTAGRSISAALRRELDGTKVAWEHAKLKDANFNIRPYTKFCVVRNPWERLVSQWRYLIQEKKTYEPRNGHRRKVSELSEKSFSWWLINHGKKSHNIVTSDTPQFSWMTKSGKFAMDHVIRFENLVEGFCGVTGLPADTLPITHKTEHCEYQKYYDKASREFVKRVFARDIKMWGYKF